MILMNINLPGGSLTIPDLCSIFVSLTSVTNLKKNLDKRTIPRKFSKLHETLF